MRNDGCDLPHECLEAIEYCCCRFQSRGLFLQPPTVGLTQGQWQVSMPSKMWDDVKRHAGSQMDDLQLAFPRREGVFGQRQDVQDAYAAYIASHWQQYESGRPVRIAACIMEPVLQVIHQVPEQLRSCLCVLGSCLFFCAASAGHTTCMRQDGEYYRHCHTVMPQKPVT